MLFWAAISTSAVAELHVNIHEVLLNLHDAEKFVQKQEDANAKMKESLRDANGEIKAMTLEEMGIRKEEDGLKKELEKERNKYSQLQNASLKLASEYKTLLNNRNDLQKENAKLRSAKEQVMSALSKIKTEMNPFVVTTAASPPSHSDNGAPLATDENEDSIRASAGPVIAAVTSEKKDDSMATKPSVAGGHEKTQHSKMKKEKEQKKEVSKRKERKADGKSKKKATVQKMPAQEETANVDFPLSDATLDASIMGDDELDALTVENPETWNSDTDDNDQVISMVQEAGFMKS